MATLDDFPVRAYEKLRYADTDVIGHVNNSVFSTMLETGRMELLEPLKAEGTIYVIVHLSIDYKGEINWPGRVDIGTQVLSVGRTSVRLYQEIFQNGVSVAAAETVIVQIGQDTHKPAPFTDSARQQLEKVTLPKPA